MLDTVFEGATVIDGTGAAPFTADVAVQDGLHRRDRAGRITGAARQRVPAHGAWLTPGFVDIHTHYDGQATWDQTFSPSIHHGVTTVSDGQLRRRFCAQRARARGRPHRADGRCGRHPRRGAGRRREIQLGKFPAVHGRAGRDAAQHRLPGAGAARPAAHGGDARACAGAAGRHGRTTSPRCATLLREALLAGAAGFSTGRSDNHRTAHGHETPASEASAAELTGLASAFQGLQHGVVQLVSDFDLLRSPERFNPEFDLVEAMARASGRPLSMTWLQRDPGGEQWKAIQARVEAAVASGLPLYLQAASRGIGVINGLDASFHPFMGFPGYKEVAHLPLAATRGGAARTGAQGAHPGREE